jgi:type IV secretory pathway protease TraF
MEHRIKTFIFCTLLTIAGCAPISDTDPPTGSFFGTALGAVAGAGVFAAFGAPKPAIAVAGIAGAGVGYYLSTLRFSSAGIVAVGGKVYTVGDYVIIDLPTDSLFEANTADFLPETSPILDSLVSVLSRYSGNNIFISGNTSGFWTERFERKMSQCRASQIAAYLWAHGITNVREFKTDSNEATTGRRLIYVGYGDEFPIANDIRIKGIRANSRIQIVASPPNAHLYWNKNRKKHFKPFGNIGSVEEEKAPTPDYSKYANAFSDDHMAEGTNLDPMHEQSRVYTPIPKVEGSSYPTVKGEYSEDSSRFNTVHNELQTTVGVSEPKQAGYKGEVDSANAFPDNTSSDNLPAERPPA